MGCPSSNTSPDAASTAPASTPNNVDLPAPLGPMMPVTTPAGNRTEAPSNAWSPEIDPDMTRFEHGLPDLADELAHPVLNPKMAIGQVGLVAVGRKAEVGGRA